MSAIPLIEFPATISSDFDGYIASRSTWNLVYQSTGFLSTFSFFLDHFSMNCFSTIEFGSNFSKSVTATLSDIAWRCKTECSCIGMIAKEANHHQRQQNNSHFEFWHLALRTYQGILGLCADYRDTMSNNSSGDDVSASVMRNTTERKWWGWNYLMVIGTAWQFISVSILWGTARLLCFLAKFVATIF